MLHTYWEDMSNLTSRSCHTLLGSCSITNYTIRRDYTIYLCAQALIMLYPARIIKDDKKAGVSEYLVFDQGTGVNFT